MDADFAPVEVGDLVEVLGPLVTEFARNLGREPRLALYTDVMRNSKVAQRNDDLKQVISHLFARLQGRTSPFHLLRSMRNVTEL